MKTHILGLPIIGQNRELKFSLEKYFKYNTLENILNIIKTVNIIITNNIKIQYKHKLDIITIGFHFINDPVTYTMLNLGILPNKFNITNKYNHTNIIHNNKHTTNNQYININNHNKLQNIYINNNYINIINLIINITKGINKIKPLKMTKWFNTNFHYFIPEIDSNIKNNYINSYLLQNEIQKLKAIKLHNNTLIKITLLGPITFIKLSRINKINKRYIIKNIIKRYIVLIKKINTYKNIKYIQFDEPCLCNKYSKKYIKILKAIYSLIKIKTNKNLLLVCYFKNIKKYINLINNTNLFCGIHIDFYKNNINIIKKINNNKKIISFGLIEGNNIWVANYQKLIKKIKRIKNIQNKNIWLSTNCSLIHTPISNNFETFKNLEWTAFAYEKLQELKILKILLLNNKIINKYNKKLNNNKKINKNKKEIKKKINNFIIIQLKTLRNRIFKKKNPILCNNINVKLLPTTTIGSFPQTNKIRKIRLNYKNNIINKKNYSKLIKKEIIKIIKLQELYNIDVIVNGEIERNDMVQYFCDNLKGCSITSNGWVQSYSTRCVKPAILWGILKYKNNKNNITKKWASHLINKCKNKAKMILTGPITLTKWAFSRNDISQKKFAYMFSFIINNEIKIINKLGYKIIQVDEPALKEAAPNKKPEQKKYFKWVTKCFQLACNSAYKNNIQIHSHICYSVLTQQDLLLIRKLGIDVLTIESSKNLTSNLKLIKTSKITKHMEIGLGIYDVHSRYIPSINTLYNRIKKILKFINIKRIWINPDCGLKTRSINDVKLFLHNLKHAVIKIKNSYNII